MSNFIKSSVVGSVGKNRLSYRYLQLTGISVGQAPGPGPRLVLPGGGRDWVPVSLVTVFRHITISVSRTTQLL